MISNEQKYIINALRDHLEGHSSLVPEGLDIARLAEIAKQQEVEAILYAQTHLTVFDKAFASACYQSVQRKQLLNKIDEAFTAQNIPYLIFKGPEVAKYYPKPELRSMGDVDILVHEDDKLKAHQVLVSEGFQHTSYADVENEWHYHFGSIEFELQDCLLFTYPQITAEQLLFSSKAWENAILREDGGFHYALTNEYHFLYLILHLRKHLMFTGAGIRYFFDLAVVIRNCNMDWILIEAWLKELKIEEFTNTFFQMIQFFFGVEVPIVLQSTDADLMERSAEMILSEGVFGFSNQTEREVNRKKVANSIRGSKNLRTGKVVLAVQTIFPPYSILRKKYPSMPHTRLLLPLMWLRRFFDALLHKRASNGLQTAVRPLTISNKEIAEREALLKQWGC